MQTGVPVTPRGDAQQRRFQEHGAVDPGQHFAPVCCHSAEFLQPYELNLSHNPVSRHTSSVLPWENLGTLQTGPPGHCLRFWAYFPTEPKRNGGTVAGSEKTRTSAHRNLPSPSLQIHLAQFFLGKQHWNSPGTGRSFTGHLEGEGVGGDTLRNLTSPCHRHDVMPPWGTSVTKTGQKPKLTCPFQEGRCESHPHQWPWETGTC